MPRIYIDDVSREPYCGIVNEGTYSDISVSWRTCSCCISCWVITLELSGCWRSRRPSLGCDTTITSSRSTTREVSLTAMMSDSWISPAVAINDRSSKLPVRYNLFILMTIQTFCGCKGTKELSPPQSSFIWILMSCRPAKRVPAPNGLTTPALADSLVHQDGRRDADVQRIGYTQHRNADMGIGSLPPLVGQARRLRPHNDGRSLSHIGIVV